MEVWVLGKNMQVEKEIKQFQIENRREVEEVMGLRQRLKLWEEKTHPQLLFGCQEYIIYNII